MKHEWEGEKILGIAEELEVIREVDKKEVSKSEMAQVYGIPVPPSVGVSK